MNIFEVESRFAEALTPSLREILRKLSYTLPEGYQLQVSLLDANGRKKRSTAAANKWGPELGKIEIVFEPAREDKPTTGVSTTIVPQPSAQPSASPAGTPRNDGGLHSGEAELLRALEHAESRPGWSFVPLKKFRDEILPQEHFRSLPNSDVELREVLRSVIDKKFVLVGKVPNPKAPQFPVTTIRLNRLMPEVKAALGLGGGTDLDFHPVAIRGEHLSATILRDRR